MRVVVEPQLDADVLEQAAVPVDELEFAVCEFQLFVVGSIHERIVLESTLQQYQVPVLVALDIDSLAAHNVGRLELFLLVVFEDLFGGLLESGGDDAF